MASELLGRYPTVPELSTYRQGFKAVVLSSATINGHVGWLHRTADGQTWFVPDDVGQSLHVAAHDCEGDCPAGQDAVARAAERAP